MSYNEELQSNNEDLLEILNSVNELPEAGSGGLGAVFDHFPTEAEILALPNNSFFTVKAYGVPYGETQIATYYRTTAWRSNALKFSDGNGGTINVVPVSQPMGEVYLPLYGIRTGKDNAEANSNILDNLLGAIEYGATLRFPVGHFYFARPIDVHNKHISILGATIAGYRHINITGTTFLHFTNVPAGQVALRVGQCTIADFTVYGNESQYSMKLDRDEDSVVPVPIVNVIGNVKNYGIWASGSMIIRNVGVRNCYYGLWCDTANMMITDVAFNHCHYGISIGNDIKCFNVCGFDVMVLLQMRGSLASATGVRGDSVGLHLVEITGGGNHTLTDLDADFCLGAIVAIGDGETASNVVNLNINGVHGRSGVSHVAATSAAEVTAQDITADNAGDFGVIAIEKGSSLLGAVITTNQTHGSNPYDTVPGFRTPFVLLSAGGATTVRGIQIFTTSYDDDEMTEAWVKGRIASCSALANACAVKVYTASGTMNYSRSNGAVVVTDDAKDIYNRMDKSALAMKGEVVLSVNGITADENGNVEVVEQEPEVVSSEDEFVDTSKRYVLDNYIYAYRKRFIPGSVTPNFLNQLPISLDTDLDGIYNDIGYKAGVCDKNGTETPHTTYKTTYLTGLIPCKRNDIVRVNAMEIVKGEGAGAPLITFYNKLGAYNFSPISANGLNRIGNAGGSYEEGTVNNGYMILSNVELPINDTLMGWGSESGEYFIRVRFYDGTKPENVVITVNEEITYTVTEDRYEWSWENTGEPYTKPDYLGMIADLQRQIDELKNA